MDLYWSRPVIQVHIALTIRQLQTFNAWGQHSLHAVECRRLRNIDRGAEDLDYITEAFTKGQCLIRSTEIALIIHISFTEFFTAIRVISKSSRINSGEPEKKPDLSQNRLISTCRSERSTRLSLRSELSTRRSPERSTRLSEWSSRTLGAKVVV